MRKILPLAVCLIAVAALAADNVAALYAKARDAFYAEDYAAAEASFIAIYTTYPQSAYAPDAAFKAGEAAFRQEHWDDAVRHFAHYLRAYPLARSAAEARERLAVAQERAGDPITTLPAIAPDKTRLNAAWIDRLAAWGEGIDRQLAGLQKAGYNAVVLPAWKRGGDRPFVADDPPCDAGAYFATDAASVCAPRLADLVVAAHKAGLLAIVVVPGRTATAGASEAELDHRWDDQVGEAVTDPAHLDLFNEDATRRLVVLARDAAKAGPDAIWLADDFALAPIEGASPGAIAAATRQFGRPVRLIHLFGAERDRAAVAAFCEARADRAAAVMAAMLQAIHEVHPSCRRGVLIEPVLVEDAVAALRDRAVDVEKVAALPVEQLVLDLPLDTWKATRGLTGEVAASALADLGRRFAELARAPERGVVFLHGWTVAGVRPVPSWQVSESLANLLVTGDFGVALDPPGNEAPTLGRAADAEVPE